MGCESCKCPYCGEEITLSKSIGLAVGGDVMALDTTPLYAIGFKDGQGENCFSHGPTESLGKLKDIIPDIGDDGEVPLIIYLNNNITLYMWNEEHQVWDAV